jgi:mono/diheme cytochrome c family protein
MKALPCLSLVLLLPGLAAAAEPVDYARDVQPILSQHCVKCHGPQKQRSSLRLDSIAAALEGGNAGPALVPGKSGESRLIQAVRGLEEVPVMPPRKPRLSGRDIAVLEAWIDQGAKGPREQIAQTGPRQASKHWAFQPIRRPALPQVRTNGWARNAVDRFILARLEPKGIRPAPEADRVTLIRRLSLDLTGLPPTPEEVDAFLADTRPDAYERLVDRLLASPHYGERWARRWLDLARYADSNGYSIDAPRSVWKYRDWVIDAFNRDLPFDQLVIHQLAGDLLPNPTPAQRVATGFHRNTQINEEGGIDLEQFRVESIVDRTNTTGTVFLGLTVGCCQCHDHKFDPLAQREYYQLFAFFNSSDEPQMELASPEQVRLRAVLQKEIAGLEKQLAALDTATPERVRAWEGSLDARSKAMLPANVRAILDIADNGRSEQQQQQVIAAYRRAEQVRHAVGGLGQPSPFAALAHAQVLTARQRLENQLAQLRRRRPVIPTTLVLSERAMPRPNHVFLGGDFLRKGAAVTPDVPRILPSLPVARGRRTRLDLARWIVRRDNPLPARVTMNRLWQHYFGIGIVETENDFGTQGTAPSHPELLDWLASEFVERGWSLKAMHRLLVTSATYRQASRHRPELAVIDPRNRLLARQNRLRLDAEVVRDVALSASGLLTRRLGGPSVFPPQPNGVYQFTQIPRTWKASAGPDRYRRGLYTFFWRSAPHPDLIVFDAPDALAACTRRNRSNTPLQALTLLNDQGFFEYAQALAARVLREAPDDSQRLCHAFRLCLARQPGPAELRTLERLLAQQLEAFSQAPDEARAVAPAGAGEVVRAAAWVSIARALLNLDECITRE